MRWSSHTHEGSTATPTKTLATHADGSAETGRQRSIDVLAAYEREPSMFFCDGVRVTYEDGMEWGLGRESQVPGLVVSC